jgi:hypothetical protein
MGAVGVLLGAEVVVHRTSKSRSSIATASLILPPLNHLYLASFCIVEGSASDGKRAVLVTFQAWRLEVLGFDKAQEKPCRCWDAIWD